MATVLGIKNRSTVGSRELYQSALLGTRKKFTDTYLVRASSTSENEDDILSAPGLPLLRSVSSGAYCYKKSAREINSAALLWEVDVDYDSHIDTQNRVVTVSWETEEMVDLVEWDQITGAPVMNSVGEPIYIEIPYEIPVLVIKRVEDTFDPDIILLYNNRCNSTYFWGAPPYCGLMKGPTADPISIDGGQKYMVTYRIKFNLRVDPDSLLPRGWYSRPLNQGTMYYPAPGEDPVPFSASNKDNITGNLNPDGTLRSRTLRPYYLKFSLRRVADFNLLNLGPY